MTRVLRAGGTVLAAVGLAACASPGAPPSPTSAPPDMRVDQPPEWRPGDRWTYRWSAGEQSGMRTVEVFEVKEVNGVRYYVARTDNVHEYWTTDLHWAAIVRDSIVEARTVPPAPWFVWPLEVGRRWSHHGVHEDRSGRRDSTHSFLVEAAETVEVPAGSFPALRVARESTTLHFDRYWYSPAVRSYVKWTGRRDQAEFELVLVEYRAGPRARSGGPHEPDRR